MVSFVRGRPLTTTKPTIEVDAGLPLGVHRFQLEVLTDDGRRSPADVVTVSVQRLVVGPFEPVVRPTVGEPVVRPTVNPTVMGTTPVIPRGAAGQAVAEPAAAPPPRRGRKPRARPQSKPRSES